MGTIKNILCKGRSFAKALIGCDVIYRVQVKCPKERHGTEYGGWVICPTGITKDSIVYSFGAGDDISFDLSLIDKYGLKVYGFDPTPRSIQWIKSQELPRQYTLSEIGIADFDGAATFSPPKNPEHISYTIVAAAETPHNRPEVIKAQVSKLKTILAKFGHSKIDILKMDIEGVEYSVIKDVIASGIDIGQLLVEFHHCLHSISISETKNAVKLLNDNGYRIFSVSPTGREYSFISEQPDPN